MTPVCFFNTSRSFLHRALTSSSSGAQPGFFTTLIKSGFRECPHRHLLSSFLRALFLAKSGIRTALISILTAFLRQAISEHGRNALYVGGHGEVVTLFAQSLHHIQDAIEEARDCSLDALTLTLPRIRSRQVQKSSERTEIPLYFLIGNSRLRKNRKVGLCEVHDFAHCIGCG